MIVYFIVILFVLLMANQINQTDRPCLNHKRNGIAFVWHTVQAKRAYIITAIVLACIAGLRYGVGADFLSYYGGVEWRANELQENLQNLDEPGISFICWIATKINPSDPRAIGIFLEASITITTMLLVIYRNSDELGNSLIYYLLLVWASCFNGVRQSLAAAVLICGLPYIKQRKLIRYCIVCFVAFLFHKSALVMLAMYFVAGKKATIRNMIFIMLGSVVLLYSYDFVFGLLGNIMTDVDTTEYATRSVNILRTLVACAPAILFWASGLYKEADEDTAFYLNITVIHAALAIAASGSSYFARVSMYTDPFMAIAIPKLGKKLYKKSGQNYMTVMTLCYTLFFLYGEYKDATEKVFKFIWQK